MEIRWKNALAGRKAGPGGRDPSIDNIRFLLIFAVVYAHLLERAAPSRYSWLIYQVIYTFHMPVFLFLYGYFVRYSPRKAVFQWFVPYMVFQTLYQLFSTHVLDAVDPPQYTTPYWLLWYLLVCLFYHLLIPLYDTRDRRMQGVTLLATVVLALAAGHDPTVGYYLSLSRFFVFQPWFVLGFYCRRHAVLERQLPDRSWQAAVGLGSLVLVCLAIWYVYRAQLPNEALFGSFYYEGERNLWMRAVLMGMALSWLVFLLTAVRPLLGRRLPLVTRIGQNTLPVFLLHGFAVRAIPEFWPQLLDAPWKAVAVALVLVLALGNGAGKWIVDAVSLSWAEKFLPRDR